MFRKPYNSLEIGFHRVGPISLDPHVNLTQDIHSKCLLMPEGLQSVTGNVPEEKFHNPVPEGVLNLMIPKKLLGPYRILSPSERTTRMQQEFSNHFDLVQKPTWAIISLLRPGSDL